MGTKRSLSMAVLQERLEQSVARTKEGLARGFPWLVP